MVDIANRLKTIASSDGWLGGKLAILLTGFALTAMITIISLLQPSLLQKADLFVYDQLLTSRAVPAPSADPVLVAIDEASLAAFGQWPWPRYRLAMLIEHLQAQGAKVVALDFLMPEPDRTSPEVIRQERRRDRIDNPVLSAANGADSNSQRLAEALANGPTILGYFLKFENTATSTTGRAPPKVPDGMVTTRLAGYRVQQATPSGQLRSLPALTGAASAEGFTNAQEDIDGTLRRVPLLLTVDGKEYPSLALATLLAASSERHIQIADEAGENILRWDHRRIPLDASGNLLIDFRRSPPLTISALEILQGKLPPDSLRNRIVLLGALATGLGDLHRTPLGKPISGLAVHATIIDNILANSFVLRPGWARGAELALVLLTGLLATILLSSAGFLVSSLLVTAGTLGCYVASRTLMVSQGIHLSPLLPMLTLLLVGSVLSLLKYGIEARKLRLRTQDLLNAQDEIIVSMSVLAEARDKETGGHIRRTQRYVEILASQLATTPRYAHLTRFDIELLGKSAPLHDIGKIGIPDAILQKPGKLTEAEYTTMQSHTLIGSEALTQIVSASGHPEKQYFLNYARQMTESHHEHWNGGGYPHHLRGEEIPLPGRLMALADVYDALISQRVYKKPYTHAEVCRFITEKSGTQFDPEIVAAFMARNEEFLKVAEVFADPLE
uniref:Metal-dependent phosphohydrolase, HD subdomain:CHASE2 n=1 Tax=Dechloromonas aromatica (strain RCB) TaxID=159087 RepID=Q47ET8_DECAR